MADKLYNFSQSVVRYGIYLVLAVPVFVSKQLFSPFTSLKIFIFRSAVEIIFIFWLILIFKDKKYRPRLNHFVYLLAIFLAYLTIAAGLGANFFHSFFGTIQRGGGVFLFCHLFAFFLILISFLKTSRDWRRYLIFFIGVSLIVSLYALLQRMGAGFVYESGSTRATGTIGNAAMLAGYLIFPAIFLLVLFFNEPRLKIKAWYLSGFLLEFLVIVLSQTRGAVLALTAGLGLWLLLGFFITAKKRLKITFAVILFLLFSSIISLYYFKESGLVRNNRILARFASVSLQDTTAKTRLFAWRGGLEAFAARPISGWGPENFNIAYNKYFNADFYNYVLGETWFDYAHNIVVELLATIGIIGLLFYLLIAAYLFKFLWRIYQSGDKILASGLFILLLTYFWQNLFVFDSINSYLSLSLVVAYIFYLRFNQSEESAPGNQIIRLNNQQAVIILLLIVFTLYSIYNFSLKGAQGAHNARQVFNEINQKEKNYGYIIEQAKNSLTNSYLWNFEYIIEYSNSFRDLIRSGITAEQRQELAGLIKQLCDQGERSYVYYNNDAMFVSRLAQLYELRYELGDKESSVLNRGQELIEKAIELSPERVPSFYILAQIYDFRGEYEKGIEALKQAIAINPDIPDTYWSLAKIYSDSNQNKTAEIISNIKKAVELDYGFKFAGDIKQVLPIFQAEKDYRSLIKLYLDLIELEPDNLQYYATLASLYKEIGDIANARETAYKILNLDPFSGPQIENFLKSLNQ